MTSPTQRSLKLLRDAGYMAEKCEQRLPIPGAFVTRDLYGLFDLMAVHPVERIVGVQVTTMAHKRDHLEKLQEEKQKLALYRWKQATGRAQLHCWRRLGARGARKIWQCDVTEL